MYDEVLRIPLILRAPGIARPLRIAEPVALLDVFRTIVELAGLPLPPGTSGESLLPLIEGAPARKEPRHLFHSRYHFEHGEHQLAVRNGRWKLMIKTPPSEQAYDERPAWSLHRPGTRFELYDLATDPGEQSNLIDSETAVALRLEQSLWAWHQATEASVVVGPKRQPRELDAGTQEALRALGYH
jgi:arylsulfatase A-like enzyme